MERENKEWIYRDCFPEKRELFEKVEEALGFKLFFWQKNYILTGNFRRFGRTTAEILRELLNVEAEPIDYTVRAQNMKENIYRHETKRLQKQLRNAGIETRVIFWEEADRKTHKEMNRDKLIVIAKEDYEFSSLEKWKKGEKYNLFYNELVGVISLESENGYIGHWSTEAYKEIRNHFEISSLVEVEDE